MTCFYPLSAYQLPAGTIVFHDTGAGRPLKLPCGQCIGCRLERSKQWATRCVHEASLYPDNSFITLTYNDESCPSDAGLRHRDFQLFMKRLRSYYSKKKSNFLCVENMVAKLIALTIMRYFLIIIFLIGPIFLIVRRALRYIRHWSSKILGNRDL